MRVPAIPSPGSSLDPCIRHLSAAVLRQAVKDLRGGGREAACAFRWFVRDHPSHPFGFGNVCDTLGLDPGWVRKAVGIGNGRSAPAPPRSSPGSTPRSGRCGKSGEE
ncbi:MAG: hypothetical protein Kow00128_10500 [Deltaproteobacteria bacterium]